MKVKRRKPPPLNVDELSECVHDELQHIMDMMFGPTDKLMLKPDASPFNEEEKKRGIEAAVEFTGATATILTDILARELTGEISEARGRELINSFISACVANEESHRVTRDTLERMDDEMTKLKKKMATKPAREKRSDESKRINTIVWEERNWYWEKKPWKRKSELGTAEGIEKAVNVRLEADGLRLRKDGSFKPLGVEAIRKRLHEMKK